jgi:Icc-related predicted phosphoesterase
VRVHVVSDVHGNATDLARAGDGADAVVCLGDLLLFIDYADHSRGILGELFGADKVGRYIALRNARRFDESRALTRSLWATLADSGSEIRRVVRAQYAQLFAAMPPPTYAPFGNVDMPALWPEFGRDGVRVLDGQVVELGGWRFGFVGGGLPTPMRTPYEVPEEEYAAKLAALGPVDVLCTHIPAARPELTYDVVARRFERGSEAILEFIARHRPRYALHGHVHQPLQARMRIGRTECVNVGHFAATGRPFRLEW